MINVIKAINLILDNDQHDQGINLWDWTMINMIKALIWDWAMINMIKAINLRLDNDQHDQGINLWDWIIINMIKAINLWDWTMINLIKAINPRQDNDQQDQGITLWVCTMISMINAINLWDWTMVNIIKMLAYVGRYRNSKILIILNRKSYCCGSVNRRYRHRWLSPWNWLFLTNSRCDGKLQRDIQPIWRIFSISFKLLIQCWGDVKHINITYNYQH